MIKYKRFGDVCKFIRGPFGGSLKKNSFKPEGIAVYEQKHAIYNQFSDIRYFIDEKKFQEMKRFELFPGDLIMSCSGTMGKVAIVPAKIKRGIINQALLKLTPSDDLDVEYLKYWMESESFLDSINKKAVGAAIKNVASVKILKEIELPYFEKEKQQQIVKILDQAFKKIDRAIANIEQNIKNAEELFQSKLNEVFSKKGEGWEEKKLGEVCILQRGFDLPKRLREKGTVPLVSSSGTIDNHSQHKVSAPGVVTGRSGSIGSVYFIAQNFWPLNTTLYVKEFFGNDSQYIYFLLRHFDLKKYATGSGVPTLNRNFVHSEKVIIASDIAKQKSIVKALQTLEENKSKLINKWNLKLESLEELKKSLLEKAFKGELTKEEVGV